MSVSRTVTPGAIYRSIAEECRAKTQSFRIQKARRQILPNAAYYEREATLAEPYEVTKKECNATTWAGTAHEDAD